MNGKITEKDMQRNKQTNERKKNKKQKLKAKKKRKKISNEWTRFDTEYQPMDGIIYAMNVFTLQANDKYKKQSKAKRERRKNGDTVKQKCKQKTLFSRLPFDRNEEIMNWHKTANDKTKIHRNNEASINFQTKISSRRRREIERERKRRKCEKFKR